MENVHIVLKNCHGIHELAADFDFSRGSAFAIYAPNGMMKTSFARTFLDLSKGEGTFDHVFPDRPTERIVDDETGAAIAPEDIVVILSYDEEMGPTEATSTLLVNADLRKEYEALQFDINEAASALVTGLKAQSKSRKDIERAVSRAFTSDDESFLTALIRINEELKRQEGAPFADVPYDTIFDDKVLPLLRSDEFKDAMAEYVGRLNELLDSSSYFSRDTFNYYNASNVTKNLADNGFFKARHSVTLHSADGDTELSNDKDMAALIEAEKLKITDDSKLREKFSKLEKQLNKNVEARRFGAFIAEHTELLNELQNVDRFNELVWKSYIKAQQDLYENTVASYRAAERRKEEIELIAAGQRTQWEEVIEIFNRRFFVPFRLTAKNREKVMLGDQKILELGFEFDDGAESVPVERKDLLKVLSTGEKKALYILNVLFEVQTRRTSEASTLFVIDDIADSFDYKNKYAIIQYLKEMSEESNFRLIILTHNFDFFRTLESRFVRYNHCRMAQKSQGVVSLIQALGIKNPFIKDLKPNFFSDPMKRLACVPFMRNLLEYTRDPDDPSYCILTSLLHWKTETAAVEQAALDGIFREMFNGDASWPDSSDHVIDMIFDQAETCLTAGISINFENKIVLSIAIRLLAEKHMVDKLADPVFIGQITSNQTPALFVEYRSRFVAEVDAHRILDSVVLMTPENIHVNSFMYEPILDMDDDHLRRLYGEVKSLAGV